MCYLSSLCFDLRFLHSAVVFVVLLDSFRDAMVCALSNFHCDKFYGSSSF